MRRHELQVLEAHQHQERISVEIENAGGEQETIGGNWCRATSKRELNRMGLQDLVQLVTGY